MAGDWIKMRGNLWDDPRVAALCDACDCGEAQIVGALYWLWSTADQHTEDGLMPGLTLRQIDRKTGVPGFGAALVAIGWIADGTDGVTLARFDEHNGASAKRRCSDAQRKATVRSVSASDADKPQKDDGQKTPNCGAREREEKSNTPHTPRGGKAAVSLKTWADQQKAAGESLIPEDDPVFAYAAEVGIPDEFMALAWAEFKHRYSQPDAKRYKDWRAVFRKAIRGNWLKLWLLDGNAYRLTTVGQQAQRTRTTA
jgi:hypothetical protein